MHPFFQGKVPDLWLQLHRDSRKNKVRIINPSFTNLRMKRGERTVGVWNENLYEKKFGATDKLFLIFLIPENKYGIFYTNFIHMCKLCFMRLVRLQKKISSAVVHLYQCQLSLCRNKCIFQAFLCYFIIISSCSKSS